MSLAAKLAAIRAASSQRIPADKLALMHQATAELRESGILDRTIKVGAHLPPFALSNAHGVIIRSPDLLQRGTVVLTVFRGNW